MPHFHMKKDSQYWNRKWQAIPSF